jgi:hypothetical protein
MLTNAIVHRKLQEVRETLDYHPICSQEGMKTILEAFFRR